MFVILKYWGLPTSGKDYKIGVMVIRGIFDKTLIGAHYFLRALGSFSLFLVLGFSSGLFCEVRAQSKSEAVGGVQNAKVAMTSQANSRSFSGTSSTTLSKEIRAKSSISSRFGLDTSVLVYSGVLGRVSEGFPVYQLVNPLAPRSFGYGRGLTSWNKSEGKPKGFILGGLKF